MSWIDGFWNYIKIRDGIVYNIEEDKWKTTNSQGYSFGEYYKNGFENATDEQIKLFNEKKIENFSK